MPMSLPDLTRPSVQPPNLSVLGIRLEDGRTETETHGTTHVGTRDFGHEDDDVVLQFGVELGRAGT